MRPVTVIGLDVENPVTVVNKSLPCSAYFTIYDDMVAPPLSIGGVNAIDMEPPELVCDTDVIVGAAGGLAMMVVCAVVLTAKAS